MTYPATSADFNQDAYATDFKASVLDVVEDAVLLDRTLFYPEGGGQPGDQGQLRLEDGQRVTITDTRQDRETRSFIWHQFSGDPALLAEGSMVSAEIDWARRYRHMRMHTALHLLCRVVEAPVTGCAITAEKGRIDFDIPEQVLAKEEITEQLAALIERKAVVTSDIYPAEEVLAKPGLVRPDLMPPVKEGKIRLVNIEGIDLQPCGGTHVRNIEEIGAISCTKIEKKGRNNRRVTLRFTEDL